MEHGIKRKLQFLMLRYVLNTLALFSQRRAGAAALKYFFKPRIGQLRPKDLEFLAGAKWFETISDNGLKVQYYVWEGTGPTVLLAHGWESNSARWRNLINRFRKRRFRIVCVDAPAHGGSGGQQFSAVVYAKFIEAVIRQIQPDYAVGHSAGAMALTFYEMEKPPVSFKKMVLMGAPSTLRAVLDLYTDFLKLSPRAKHSIDACILHRFGKPVEYFAIEDMAPHMDMPCLIIHDEGDKTAHVEGAERAHRNWPNSQFLRTQGLGHSLQGEEAYAAVLRFLEQP